MSKGNRAASWQGMNWIRQDKRFAIYARDGFCCAYCNARMEDGAKLTLDHVLAVELGGSNEASNLVTACFSCNSAKQDSTTRKWFRALRDRGIDPDAVGPRVRALTAKPIDRKLGAALVAARKGK